MEKRKQVKKSMTEQITNPALTDQKVPPLLSRGDKRKLLIVETTISLLAQKGLQHLTFEAIGQACQISKSHVAYHFPSLEELLRTSVSYVYTVGQRTVSDYIQKEDNKAKLLQAYVYGTFYWIESHPAHSSVAALLGYLATWDERYRHIQTEIKKVGVDRIVAILQTMTGKREKTFLTLADSIQSLLVGKLLYFSATEKKQNLYRVRAETWKVITRLLQ